MVKKSVYWARLICRFIIGIYVSYFSIYQTISWHCPGSACDIILKHLFLRGLNIYQNSAYKVHQN